MKPICAVVLLAGLLVSPEPLQAANSFARSPNPERMPSFSWDTVPRYMHVRKVTAFTPAEVEYLASFPLVTFEKTTGSKEFGSTEAGTEQAAKAVKRINPSTKILYYRNILVHYPSYHEDRKLEKIKGAFLVDRNGNAKLVRQQVRAYDLSNDEVQAWWLGNAKWVCSSKYIDGLFVDGNIKVLEPGYLRDQIGADKKDAVIQAYHKMMKQLPQALGSDELILANIIRARFDDAGLGYLGYFDGSYIEGFEHEVGRMSRADYVAKGIEAVQTAARSGKIIAFTIGTGKYADTDMDDKSRKTDRKTDSTFQQQLTYKLALFLVCAEKYSYFMLSDGYGVDGGNSRLWMNPLPEYSRPLGPPKGPAQKRGYVYERSFQYADVSLDIENETASIVWKRQ
ncbi:putative glycoside hydrolase [Pontiella sp.]|uniref:putative glycoside hydrolase n=1 Tax=Pontiella sp. TaxID=2837462 RepID=UPI003564C681